jgi:hypothetical protein
MARGVDREGAGGAEAPPPKRGMGAPRQGRRQGNRGAPLEHCVAQHT